MRFCVDGPLSLTNKPGFTTLTAAVKQKGKSTPVQEEKPRKSQKEGQPKVIRPQKVPANAREPAKPVLAHTAEVTNHSNLDLAHPVVHNREEEDIVTVSRPELTSSGNQEAVWRRSVLEVGGVAVEEAEREVWTRSLREKKEDELEGPDVEKKVHALSKKEEQKECVKLKLFKKSESSEDLEEIILKKVPQKSKKPKMEVETHQAEVARHYDSQVVAQKLCLSEEGVVKEGKSGHLLSAAQEPSDLGHLEEQRKFKEFNRKHIQITAAKTSSFEEPCEDLTNNRIELLPQKEEEQKVMKLKSFKKPQKAETKEPTETQKYSETKTGAECSPFQSSGALLRDQQSAIFQTGEDQQDVSQRSEPAASPIAMVSTSDNKKELLTSIPSATGHQRENNAAAASENRKPSSTEKTLKDPNVLQPSNKTPENKKAGFSEKEVAEQKKIENQTDAYKKELKPKRSPSLNVAKAKPKVEPLEQIENVKLTKTPVQKFKEVDTEERISTITLKKSPHIAAAPEQAREEQLHLVKQVSPGAVQVRKLPTQPEEEVFKEVPEEEEEVWGWELSPAEDWIATDLNGAVETPGPPGSKRGEVTSVQPTHPPDLS